MPVIKIWCLPIQGESKLTALHRAIVTSVVSIKELGLKNEKDMTVLFPPDMMKYGLGTDILVEISGLFQKKERTKKVRQNLAKAVGETVKNLYPQAKVECSVQSFSSEEGFWVSPPPEDQSPKLSEVNSGKHWLTTRDLNCLRKAGIETEKQLLDTSVVEIVKLPAFGPHSFHYLKAFALEKNYELKDIDKIENLLKEGYTLSYIKSKLI